MDGFDTHTGVDEVATDLDAGYATSIGGRFGSIDAPVLVNDRTPDGVLNDRVEGLYWIQFRPEAMVETVGRDALLDTPGWCVDERPDAAILVNYPTLLGG